MRLYICFIMFSDLSVSCSFPCSAFHSFGGFLCGPKKLASSKPDLGKEDSYTTIGGLNHIAVVVDDLDAVEAKVKAIGLTVHSHADYEPGKRFYFNDADEIEFEIVCYD